MPPTLRTLAALAAVLLAADAAAQPLAADVRPPGAVEAAPLGVPTGDLLAMTGAGVAASGAVVVLAYEVDEGAILTAAPFAAALAVYGVGEALGNDGSLIATTTAAGLGGLFGLAAAVTARDAGAGAQRAVFAVVPALCAVAAFRVGAPGLLLAPTGEAVPAWTVRVGV